MANALTLIELDAAQRTASAGSLRALCHGRRIATDRGATLYAMVPCAAQPPFGGDDFIETLSQHGADKVVLIVNAQLTPPLLFASHGEALMMALRQFPPQLVLLPTGTGEELGVRLSLELDGYYIGDATIDLDDPDLTTVRPAYRRQLRSRTPLLRAQRPLIVELAPGVEPLPATGADEAEVIVLQAPSSTSEGFESVIVSSSERPRLVLGGGAGLDSSGFDMLDRLGTVLGASAIVSSSTARSLGLSGDLPQVGVSGQIDADVYLAFAVSGSERHLAAVGPTTRVIAVNNDPDAPIWGVADVGVVADAGATLESLLSSLPGAGPEDIG